MKPKLLWFMQLDLKIWDESVQLISAMTFLFVSNLTLGILQKPSKIIHPGKRELEVVKCWLIFKKTHLGLIDTTNMDDAPHGMDASWSKHEQTWGAAHVTHNVVILNTRRLKPAKKKTGSLYLREVAQLWWKACHEPESRLHHSDRHYGWVEASHCWLTDIYVEVAEKTIPVKIDAASETWTSRSSTSIIKLQSAVLLKFRKQVPSLS